ncbi:MAG: leucine-rich repeat domain-containing protein [Bacteroidetes bacterium]|jgi:leucine-rich repeat protein SHOC2|nr:MAG: leucine-rich repeat domain-containing protein [Bacteroidota bacterium]
MKKLFLLIFPYTISCLYSQEVLLDSLSLASAKEYNNLDSALKQPDKVYKLVLRKQKLKSFPQEIFLLKNLQYLDISKNNIKKIPDNIHQLKYLQYFSCSKCKLSKIPESIGQLEHLYYLNLNQNDIDSLPESIGNLKKLRILDLWDNNLSYFPYSMNHLENLKIMDVRSILLNEQQQNYIQSLLPNTKIYFSPPCRCSW